MSGTEAAPTDLAQTQGQTVNTAKQIFVAKLPTNVTRKDLEHLFDRYGNITEINIKKNFAFIVDPS